MVEVNGLEPMASCVQGRQSPLSLHPVQIHHLNMVEVNGFEPMTSCVQGRRSPS